MALAGSLVVDLQKFSRYHHLREERHCFGYANPTDPRLGGGLRAIRNHQRKASASGPLRVVLAARMLWDKGVREFVEAARMLKLQGRPLRFQLAGGPDPGNPASIPELVLRDWQASGLVDWLGHVDDMPALLASADIVVLPSYREGLPKSLIEAAACARPLVTTDVPGCREVVTDCINGLIVPVRDASALAQAIARLQDKPSFARRLGEAARVKTLAEYDERRIVPRNPRRLQRTFRRFQMHRAGLAGGRPEGRIAFRSK